jgi:hypothetical protein
MFGLANISGRFDVNAQDSLIYEASLGRRREVDDEADDDCDKLPAACNSSSLPWSLDLPELLSRLKGVDYLLINQGAHGAPHLCKSTSSSAASSSPQLDENNASFDHHDYIMRVIRAAAAAVEDKKGRVWAKTSHLPLADAGVKIQRCLSYC